MSVNTTGTVGLILATRWEAGGVIRRFGFRKVGKNLYETSAGGRKLLLAISGVGMEPARTASYRLCDLGAKELISSGFCGALVPELRVGDLITDRLATALLPVRSRDEREALARRANAVAVDMETQAIVEAGTRRGVPVRILRAVSDCLGDDLTPLFGSSGRFSPWRIALNLLKPPVWPLAAQLRRNSAAARRRIEQGLADLLHAVPQHA